MEEALGVSAHDATATDQRNFESRHDGECLPLFYMPVNILGSRAGWTRNECIGAEAISAFFRRDHAISGFFSG